MKKLNALEYNYEVKVDLPILPKGAKLALDSGYYVNEQEKVILKSTNLTGKIIKKI